MAYHAFTDPESGAEYGSFETFYVPRWAQGARAPGPSVEQYPTIYPCAGWYWHARFPGCMPDGEPTGPFESESAAIDDAREA